MARASNIYLVYHVCTKQPLACFTVKYESQNWTENFCKKHGDSMERFSRFRMRDGGRSIYGGSETELVECPWEDET